MRTTHTKRLVFLRRIGPRLAMAFTLLFVFLLFLVELTDIFGLPGTSIQGATSQRREEAFHKLALVADLKKDALQRWLEERRDDAFVMGNNPLLIEKLALLLQADRNTDPSEAAQEALQSLREYLMLLEKSYGVCETIEIAEALSGQIKVSTDPQRIGMNLPGYDAFLNSVRLGELNIRPVELSAKDRKPVFSICQPIFQTHAAADNNQPLGLLIMSINIGDIIRPLLQTGEALGNSGEALLIDQETRILTRLKHPLKDGSRPGPLEYTITALPAALASQNHEGLVQTRDYRGEPVLAAFRHIPLGIGWGWGLVVKQDQAELFAPLREDIMQSLYLSLGALLLSMVCVALLSKSLTKPLRVLSHTAAQAAAGNLAARSNIASGDDEIGLLATTFDDMLARIQAGHEELEQAVALRTHELNVKNEELEQVVFVASHDLRSPLVNIDGYGKELSQDLKTLLQSLESASLPESVRKTILPLLEKDLPNSIRFIRGSTAQMDALLSGMLKLSRSGRAALFIETLDMNRLVAEVLEGFEFQFKEVQVTVEVGDLPLAYGDVIQVKQVFANLIGNAFKYFDPDRKGIVKISGKAHNKTVDYCVADNGIGIAPTYLDRIFDIFYRIHPLVNEGDGMGLAIVKRILNRLGGDIRVESAPGEGTRFYVTLPEGRK